MLLWSPRKQLRSQTASGPRQSGPRELKGVQGLIWVVYEAYMGLYEVYMGVYEGVCTKSAPKACQTVTQRGKTTPGVFNTVSNAKGSSPVLPASSPSDVVEPLRLLMLRFIVGWEMLDLSISEGRSHDVSSVTARRKTVTLLSSSVAERSTCLTHHRSFAKLSVCYTVAGC